MNARGGEVDLLVTRDRVEGLVEHLHALDLGALAITKRGHNVQTTHDLAADAFLKDGLPGILGIPIMSEEDPEATLGQSGWNWVVDPIDGTINELVGVPQHTSTSVALVDADAMRALLGIVRWRRKAGPCFSAVAGHGARRDGQPFTVHDPQISPDDPAYRTVGFGVPGNGRQVADRLGDTFRNIWKAGWRTQQLGSACIEITNVAQGGQAAFIEYNLNFWDFAAAALIAKEAGCAVRTVQTGPYTHDIVVARNQEVLDTIGGLAGILEPTAKSG